MKTIIQPQEETQITRRALTADIAGLDPFLPCLNLSTKAEPWRQGFDNTKLPKAKSDLAGIRLGSFDIVRLFSDAEIKLHGIFDSFATTAQRSSIDILDRGLQILQNLPTAPTSFQ